MTDIPLPNLPEWQPVEVSVTVPPVTRLDATPVAAQVRKLHDLAIRAYEAAARHRGFITTDAMREARDADTRAHGAAIAAGQPDPGTPNVDALFAFVQTAHREASGLAEAANVARAELGAAVIGDPGAEWVAELDTRRAGVTARVLRALDDLTESCADLQATVEEDTWRSRVVSHERGEVGRLSESRIAWPANFNVSPRQVYIGSRNNTVADLAAIVRDWFVSGEALRSPRPQRAV